MVDMTPKPKAALLMNTREAAEALLEDLQHLRKILETAAPDKGDIRRSSAILRRLAVERGISVIAAPRIGKFSCQVHDNKIPEKEMRGTNILFFVTGGAVNYGVSRFALTQPQASKPMPPPKRVSVKLDGFLSQKVLCHNNKWASRGDVIKYVANIAHGVHSGKARADDKEAFDLIGGISRSLRFSLVNGDFKMSVDVRTNPAAPMALAYDSTAIDPVLFELLSAAYFLIHSDSTAELEKYIKAELGIVT